MSNTNLYEIALSFCKGIGPVRSKKLIKHFGSAEAIFNASKDTIASLPYIHKSVALELNHTTLDRAQKELEFAISNQIRVISYFDDLYPALLKEIPDSPLILYFRGKIVDYFRTLAVVGTRLPSDYGKSSVHHLMSSLNPLNPVIVSGLAEGIDALAHRAAVQAGLHTIGVLAHGLDRIYPESNRGLARDMLNYGGLLTEFPSGTKPDRENFPLRNRIIAGLSHALIVVESGIKGGSMISADFANQYNREVFAFPGRVSDERSHGCNLLIKSHRANLIESAKDLEYVMGWKAMNRVVGNSMENNTGLTLDNDERIIFELLQRRSEMTFEALVFGSQLSLNALSNALLNLELKSLIRALPGKRFSCL